MKSRTIAVAMITLMLFATAALAAPDALLNANREQKARTVAETFIKGIQQNDTAKTLSVLADDFHAVFTGWDKSKLEDLLEKTSDTRTRITDPEKLKPEIQSVTTVGDRIEVKCSYYSSSGSGLVGLDQQIMFMQDRGGELRIVAIGDEPTSAVVDQAAHRVRSVSGGFSLPVPDGWIPLAAPTELRAIAPEGIIVLAPDLKSFACLGYVQMPIKMPGEAAAKMGIEADEAITKRLASKYTASEAEVVSAGDVKGYRTVSEFALEGQARKRMRAYFAKEKSLYFLICDAIPPERFDALRPQFDAVVTGLRVLEASDGNKPGAEQARGSLAGNVYRNEDFKCQIAAPKGWSMDTSPNPGHLVEMNYEKGKSIARLIAAKGIPADATAKKLFEQRLEQVKGIVQNFKETSRREAQVAGQPAMESEQSYSIEAFGNVSVKEVTIVKDGTYYLILCQVMEPDSYEQLEPDFDAIIQSFGFAQ